MIFHIITLFPESFESYFSTSIIGRAIKDKKIKVNYYNPRNFSKDKHNRIDQKPYGGGPGMVIEALPVIRAIEKAKSKAKGKVKIFFLSPGGKQFSTEIAKKTTKSYKEAIIVCGRYEGIDSRIKKVFKMEDISIGPYVVTGGELGAMILVDTISRQIKGVLGDFDSREEARISSHDVYTRPEIFEYKGKKYKVPPVLLSGNHKAIDEFRAKNSTSKEII